MNTPASDALYYLLRFDATADAAAFVAALSRYLDSPGGREFDAEPGALEVWSDRAAPVELYLAPAALAAAEAAFSPVPPTKVVRGSDMPASCTLLVGHNTPPWGMSEITARLRDRR